MRASRMWEKEVKEVLRSARRGSGAMTMKDRDGLLVCRGVQGMAVLFIGKEETRGVAASREVCVSGPRGKVLIGGFT